MIKDRVRVVHRDSDAWAAVCIAAATNSFLLPVSGSCVPPRGRGISPACAWKIQTGAALQTITYTNSPRAARSNRHSSVRGGTQTPSARRCKTVQVVWARVLSSSLASFVERVSLLGLLIVLLIVRTQRHGGGFVTCREWLRLAIGGARVLYVNEWPTKRNARVNVARHNPSSCYRRCRHRRLLRAKVSSSSRSPRL